MIITPEFLAETKEYLRIDGEDDDPLLENLIISASEYLLDAGVVNTESRRYRLAVWILVTEWYENRGISTVSGKLQNSLQSLILQLR